MYLSVAGEEKIVQKVLRSETQLKWLFPHREGKCFTFTGYTVLQVQHAYTDTSRGSAPQNPSQHK